MSRALVIDAFPLHAESLARVLRDDGFDVDVASAAGPARELLSTARPELILCDLDLPNDQHLDFCRWLKKSPEGQRIVLVAHSHQIEPERILDSLEAGADGFLTLVRPADELVQAVRGMLARGPRPVITDGGRLLVSFRNRPYVLGIDREHLLDVLVSAFEDLHHVNQQLHREAGERGRAEEDIFRMQERFDLAVSGTGDGIWDWDVARNIVYFSPRWKEMLGFADHELGGTFDVWKELLHPEDRERALGTIQDYFDGRTATYELEHRLRHKDGTYRWILARGRAIRSADGKPLRMAGSHADITERKVMEAALLAREAQLRRFNNVLMDLAIHESTLADDLALAMIHFTETTARTLGIARCSIWLLNADHAELRCQSLYDDGRHVCGTVLRGTDFPAYFHALESEQIIAANDAQNDPRTCEFRDDYLIPHGITSMLDAPLRLRGEVVGVLCSEQVGATRCWSQEEQNFAVSVASLISLTLEATERRRAEREARSAKDAAEAANRAKSAFLANMSHEIRTPMNAIIGMTELTLETSLNNEQREYLELVRKSADNLLGIINEILDFSKIEAGRLELDRAPFSPQEIVGEVLGSLAPRAYQKGLELIGHVAPELPEMLIGDSARLRQVLLNLAGNAIKFTEQGEVLITVREVPLVRSGPPAEEGSRISLHFEVRDTGIGIPVDKQRLIFEPFTQADSSTTRRFGGTGLGLTISTRLVELMGGHIGVKSAPGSGSVFSFTATFELPSQPGAPRWPTIERFRGLPVLVVDDNATNRRILDETLKHWGMRPTCVASAREALIALDQALAGRNPFALVLLDGQMPEMDGFELAEQIRRRPELSRATVMMLTSGGRPGDASRCDELGISAYLTKPVRQRELRRAVEQALGGAARRQADLAAPDSSNRSRSLHVLLAEDNPVNQKLAVRLLEKRGHRVTLAASGREAIARWLEHRFDIILMDVQMPEMDGFEAAYAIRERESGTGRHTPILAMTAYAMKGDRERCLDAGMDEYVSKPIRSDELFNAIERLTSGGPAVCEPAAESINQIVDWSEALAYVGGDEQLLRDLTRTFLEQMPIWLKALDEALQRQDAPGVESAAHPFKNSLNLLGAREAGRLMYALESMGRRRDLAGADAARNALRIEFARLVPAWQRFVTADSRTVAT